MGAALEEANGQIQDLLLDHQVQGERDSGNEPNGTRPTPTSARQSHPMNREVSLHVVLHYTVKFHVGVANFGVETPVHDVS